MKDPICEKGGCYMFAGGTPERATCEKTCRLNDPREVKFAGWNGNPPPRHPTQEFPASASPEMQNIPFRVQGYDHRTSDFFRKKLPAVQQALKNFDYAELEMRVVAKL